MQLIGQTWLNLVTLFCRSYSEGQHGLSSRFIEYALYLEDYLMYEHQSLG